MRTVSRGAVRPLVAATLVVVALLAALLLTSAPASAVEAPAAPPAPTAPQGPAAERPAPGVTEEDGDAGTDAGQATDGEEAADPDGPAPIEPAEPVAPIDGEGAPGVDLRLDGSNLDGLSNPVALVLLLAVVSLVPALLLAATAFTRIIIVLSFTRSALSTPGIPTNQVLIGLALFLTAFVMAPTLGAANEVALQPYLAGQIPTVEALDRAQQPFRQFMFAQVRQEDLAMFVDMSGAGRPATPDDVPTTTLVPAFVLSELRTAFLIGFVVFVPFLVIDLVVSAALTALGMVMLPPALVSLPIKVLLFVAADGWSLVVSSLVRSFQAPGGAG